jgi:uncharacterized protein
LIFLESAINLQATIKKKPRVIYLHGFNSSPASQKARSFTAYCHDHGVTDVVVPALSHDPGKALAAIAASIGNDPESVALLVGSSLGGYYATWFTERTGIKAALINPAVRPCDNLPRSIIGQHRNQYTGAEYDFTEQHVEFLRSLQLEQLRDPSRYLLLVQTGDETLDYRLAVEYYAGAEQIVQPGGSHAFQDFDAVLPRILQFAALH